MRPIKRDHFLNDNADAIVREPLEKDPRLPACLLFENKRKVKCTKFIALRISFLSSLEKFHEKLPLSCCSCCSSTAWIVRRRKYAKDQVHVLFGFSTYSASSLFALLRPSPQSGDEISGNFPGDDFMELLRFSFCYFESKFRSSDRLSERNVWIASFELTEK